MSGTRAQGAKIQKGRADSSQILSDMTMEHVQEKIKGIQKKTEKHMSEELKHMVEQIIREVENNNNKIMLTRHGDKNGKYTDRTKPNKPNKDGALPQKQFLARNSLLTELFEIKHIRSIYHIFLVILIISFMNTVAHDLMENGTMRLGLRYVVKGFNGFQTVLLIWLAMFGCTIIVYPLFCTWANALFIDRPSTSPRSDIGTKVWNYGWLSLLFCYYAVFLYLPAFWVGSGPAMGIASKAVVLTEQIRLLMKTHAFIRHNAAHADGSSPGFSTFLYFLFAPTLVYRHSYPRSGEVRWRMVVLHFLEVLGAMFYFAYIVEHYLVPVFSEYGVQKQTWRSISMSIFNTILPSSMMFLCGFYLLLHAWMNGWAEMLRFADRMFYKDWWNSTSFGMYYRTWNVVVHDWLYTYIYKDMYEVVLPRSKPGAMLTVFIISAIVHEYIIGFMLGFCYPIMFIQFAGFGASLNFLRVKDAQVIGNVFIWWSLACGMGIQVTFYAIEFYARINCQSAPVHHSFLDYFIPRSWSC